MHNHKNDHGPSVWNNLPQTLRHSDSASFFKAALKTHLFNNCLSQPCLYPHPIVCVSVRVCTCVCVCVPACVCAVSVIVKHPVLPTLCSRCAL